ncbi:MAG TPA: SUMF1/EgtB/PvdO family nonheme iron enzyme [Pirellulaceae bacterium]|nr:SUMF1/EgtB/PvdO family nonheme iron enzyme [Pirellulaceae bacterium]
MAITRCAARYLTLVFMCASTATLFAEEDKSTKAARIDRVLTELSLFDVEAMSRVIKDLAGKHPGVFDKAKLLAELKAKAAAIKETTAALKRRDATAIAAAQAICDFKRRVLLANPILDFDHVIAVRRAQAKTSNESDPRCAHVGMADNWLVNTAITRTGWDSKIGKLSLDGEFTPLATSTNFMGDLNLHFNAGKVLFSSISKSNTWQVFELNLEDNSIRQVSHGKHADIDNFDACYLPGGKIIYASTAGFQGVPCIGGNGDVANLHVMNDDGTAVRRLTFDQDSNWSPYVMENGRVMYQRWEYADISHFWSRILFTMNPDGTDQKAYYGSNSFWPNTLFYGKSVPGSPSKFTAIVGNHHGVQRAGKLVLFDVAKGRVEADGVIQGIPGLGKKIEPVVVDGFFTNSWPKILHPQPLSEDYHLAAVKLNATDKFGIYLIDSFDNLLPLRRSESHHFLEPIAFRRRKMPPVRADRVRPAEKEATVFISDIYTGQGLAGVPRGTVKKLRIFKYEFSPRKFGGHAQVGIESAWDLRVILGTVDVEKDGSVMFKLPSNTPVSLQPLDVENKSLALMRSWMTAMPGEILSCTGCHESHNEATPTGLAIASGKTAQTIHPWYGAPRGFSFTREVQPVLDKYCVGCHDGKSEDRPDFADSSLGRYGDSNFMQNEMPRSYYELQKFVRRSGPEGDSRMLVPLNFHADTSELVQILSKGHHNVKLDTEAWDRLITWIDLNVPAHGSYGEMSPNTRAVSFLKRREDLLQEYATTLELESEIIRNPYKKTDTFIRPEKEAETAAPPKTAGWPFLAKATSAKTIDLGDGILMELVTIPAGEFVMGSNSESPTERPMHTVEIRKPFEMGVTEVTLQQYRQFEKNHTNGSYDKPGIVVTYGFSMDKSIYPVIRVSWEQANAFCAWLSKKTGKKVLLPTEAQWEWACRAGSDTPVSFGADLRDYVAFANMSDASSDARRNSYARNHWALSLKDAAAADKAHCLNDVGSYKANGFGLKDMHGNVAEWTRSEDKPYPYSDSDGRNAQVRGRKVVRGGSWDDRPRHSTSSYRLSHPSWQRVYDVGFRVIVE